MKDEVGDKERVKDLDCLYEHSNVMIRVVRPKDTVFVLIMKLKDVKFYKFVNLSKGHICPCLFPSVAAALEDLDSYVERGEVISYDVIVSSSHFHAIDEIGRAHV